MSPDAFYLGTHNPAWLATLGVPLCVSRVRMVKRKSFPRALKPWMFDSGAFSEIAKHGRWTVSAKQYAGEVARVDDEVGQLAAVAPQDWMCEPHMLRKTGFTVRRHQELTTRNFLELRDLGVSNMTKAEIVATALALNVPFELTHSCYAPLSSGRACGRCDSCQIRAAGFAEVGIVDPCTLVR